MRIWRDIPSSRAVRRLLGRLEAPRITNVQAQSQLLMEEEAIRQVEPYHAIPKDKLANLPQRLNKLRSLAAFLETNYRPGGQLPRQLLYGGATNPREIMLGLAKRARAKASYIALLIEYYQSNQSEVTDPENLVRRLQVAQQRSTDEKSLGVVPGVRMEAWDPVHRNWEMAFTSTGDIDSMGKTHQSYAAAWLRAVRGGACKEPLLVYLESTEHCLDRDMARQAHVVEYQDVTKGRARVYQLRVREGVVEQARMGQDQLTWEPFDTSWVSKADSAKGGFTHTLAYNWTTTKELYADLHNPDRGREWDTFHHSSFTGGGLIRCAGMIGGRSGKIVYIDNDSGHYRPDTTYLHRLVKHIHKRDAFADNARVRDVSLRDSPAGEESGIPAKIYVLNPRGSATPWVRGRYPPTLGGHRG